MEWPHPEDPAARHLVTELYGVEDPSPTFISDTIHCLENLKADDPTARELVTKLIQSEDPSPTFVRDALNGWRIADAGNDLTDFSESTTDWPTDWPTESPTEKHEAGKNDLMAGAKHPSGQRRKKHTELLALSPLDNDSTVCESSLSALLKYMPFKLLSTKEFLEFDLYHDVESASALPEEFYTTPTGLEIVIRHFWSTLDAEAEYDDDELNEQLSKVGGVLQNNWSTVCYPEDLVPCAEWRELEDCHKNYWRRLHAMTFPEKDAMEIDEDFPK